MSGSLAWQVAARKFHYAMDMAIKMKLSSFNQLVTRIATTFPPPLTPIGSRVPLPSSSLFNPTKYILSHHWCTRKK